MAFSLSKTQFQLFEECPVALWLERFHPEWLPPPDANELAAQQKGNEVDAAARGLWPGGRLLTGGWEATRAALAGDDQVFFQPLVAAEQEGLLCRADVLCREGAVWDIWEVKASKRVKEEHYHDVGFQFHCLERAGLPVGLTRIVHLNGDYVRRGEIDLAELFTVVDITRGMKTRLPALKRRIHRALDFTGRWRGSAKTDDVLKLCTDAAKCPWSAALRRGLAGEPVPVAHPPAVASPERAYLTDEARLRRFLGDLRYPLHYFDYETYDPAIPWYDGYRPYEFIPFQFSLDIVPAPGAPPEHHEFLAMADADPVPELVRHLQAWTRPTGSFLAWFAPFEKGRNEEMACRYPQAAAFLRDVNRRMADLMVPFRKKGGMVHHPDSNGSASLKVITPLLVGDRYAQLRIREGGAAMSAWPQLIGRAPLDGDRGKLQRDMLAYCAVDTMNLVEIHDWLRRRLVEK